MTWNIDHLRKAWNLATRYHDGQKYGGHEEGMKVEYLNHIGGVTFEILNSLQYEEGVNADLALACAVLHDTLEDTALDKEKIRELFGEEILAGVQALTKNKRLPSKAEQMQDSLNRILQQPREVAMVKLADRINNLNEPPFYWDEGKKRAYREEGQMIYEQLKGASVYLGERLKMKIDQYEAYF
ncbi:MAG: HD domain-containing protein [Bacteroidota bacterium]